MIKKVAILLNSPVLGGAERSVIQQSLLIEKQHQVFYFVPLINDNQKQASRMIEFIHNFF